MMCDFVSLLLLVHDCSFLGSGSIIVSAMVRKRVCSSEVHPIFMLSLADLLLAVLWVTGSGLWFLGGSFHRVYCYVVTLSTAVSIARLKTQKLGEGENSDLFGL